MMRSDLTLLPPAHRTSFLTLRQIAAFCIAFLVSGFAFLKWRLLSESVRKQVWKLYGIFTALMCVGSFVGSVAFAANMKYRNLFIQFSIELENVGYFAYLASDLGRISLYAYNGLLWQIAYNVLYPIELAFLSFAKLLALDRMVNLAKFRQTPSLQLRVSRASRVVVLLVVCINVVSIAGGIVTAVNLQTTANLYAAIIAKYNANPGFLTAQEIIQVDLPKGDADYHMYNKNSSVQFFSEVALLALLIAVFVVTGIVCIRRALALVIAPSDTELEENRQALLRRIGGTVLAIAVSFLLRIVYAILSSMANLWMYKNLTPQQLGALLIVGLTDTSKLVSSLQSNSDSPSSDLNCLFLAIYLFKNPEFQILVILLSSPVTLLVALWGMTTLQARALLFPSIFRGKESRAMAAPLAESTLCVGELGS
jgi:hypothetical protein